MLLVVQFTRLSFPYKLSKYAFTGKGWTCSSFLKYSGWWGWPFFDRFPAHSHRA